MLVWFVIVSCNIFVDNVAFNGRSVAIKIPLKQYKTDSNFPTVVDAKKWTCQDVLDETGTYIIFYFESCCRDRVLGVIFLQVNENMFTLFQIVFFPYCRSTHHHGESEGGGGSGGRCEVGGERTVHTLSCLIIGAPPQPPFSIFCETPPFILHKESYTKVPPRLLKQDNFPDPSSVPCRLSVCSLVAKHVMFVWLPDPFASHTFIDDSEEFLRCLVVCPSQKWKK